MSMAAGALRTHGMRPSALVQAPPPRFASREFMALRNDWYRRLEAEGHEIEEYGYTPTRLRRRKGIPLGAVGIYSTARSEGQSCWDQGDAEHWRVMSEQVERLWDGDYWRVIRAQVNALPAVYRGMEFLRRWAEIGDVNTAAHDVGISRWRARKIHQRFILLLKRKRVLK